ncbi:DUF262 domain-containing protein [bacterium]|nr:DUF262 domain-containing protein [bacterium]
MTPFQSKKLRDNLLNAREPVADDLESAWIMYDIVDGQQRLITMTIIQRALGDHKYLLDQAESIQGVMDEALGSFRAAPLGPQANTPLSGTERAGGGPKLRAVGIIKASAC